MHALPHSQNCHLDQLVPVEVQSHPPKPPLDPDPVRMPLKSLNLPPNSPLRVHVPFHRRSIHPLPSPINPFRNTLPLTHPLLPFLAPRISIFPAPLVARFAPFLTSDQRAIRLPLQNPLHFHPLRALSAALPLSYPIMALRPVPHRHHQISLPCPFLLPSLPVRAPHQRQCPLWTSYLSHTLSGRTLTSESMFTAKQQLATIDFWDSPETWSLFKISKTEGHGPTIPIPRIVSCA